MVKMMILSSIYTFGYSVRDELISGQNSTFAYDDIGNRTTAEGKTYTANALNQYTAVDTFVPEYNADGNQTKIQTATGKWTVDYNAENRPVRWTQGTKVITMTFDRMGRRVAYVEKNGETIVKHDRFVYDNYLCIQRLDAMQNNSVRTRFVWDPTEPLATRPLFMRAENWGLNLFYSHDGNKNVSEVFYYANQNGIAAHYDYAPFGAVTRTARNTRVTNRDIISENPFRFSSEVHDDTLALVYYNYRHYNPTDGRWIGRDQIFLQNKQALYRYINNRMNDVDFIGFVEIRIINNFVSSAEDFGQGFPYGSLGFFEANYTIITLIAQPVVFRRKKDTTCETGCRWFVKDLKVSFTVEEESLKMYLPKIENRRPLGLEKEKRLATIIHAITQHEQSHYRDYSKWKTDIEREHQTIPYMSNCDQKELEIELTQRLKEIKPYTQDLNVYYNETHQRIGKGIKNLEDVISAGAVIEYEF